MSLEDYLASRTRDRHRIPSTEEEDSTAVLGSQLLPSAGPSRFHSLRSIIKGLPDQEDLDGEGYYGGGNDLQPTTTHFESTVPQDEQQWSSRRQSRVAPKPVAKSPANFARAGRHFDLASMVSAEDSSVLAPQEYLEARQTPAMVVRDMDQTMDVHQTSDGTRNDFEVSYSWDRVDVNSR